MLTNGSPCGEFGCVERRAHADRRVVVHQQEFVIKLELSERITPQFRKRFGFAGYQGPPPPTHSHKNEWETPIPRRGGAALGSNLVSDSVPVSASEECASVQVSCGVPIDTGIGVSAIGLAPEAVLGITS
jgi:hypothetical protein